MSKSGNKKSFKKVKFGTRFELFIIKTRVICIMTFFKKVNVERETVDFEIMEEIKKWSKEKGYSLEVIKKEYPIYIYGHANYKIDGYRHRIVLHFSR